MKNCCGVFLVMLFCTLYVAGSGAAIPSAFPKYRISNKEIHLEHGKLHPHEGIFYDDDDDHMVYKYHWLGDDIIKPENDFEGEEDDEYPDDDKKVQLPGGCELTENQYLELESFKKETEYVKKCYCESGGVYCQINKNLFRDKII